MYNVADLITNEVDKIYILVWRLENGNRCRLMTHVIENPDPKYTSGVGGHK